MCNLLKTHWLSILAGLAFSLLPLVVPAESTTPVRLNSMNNHVDVPADTEIHRDSQRGTVRFLKSSGIDGSGANKAEYARLIAEQRDGEIALLILQAMAGELRLESPKDELTVKSISRDELGMAHVQFDQIYRHLPVYRGEIRVHLDRAHRLTALEGSYIPTPRGLDVTPKLSVSAARQAAGQHTGMGACEVCPADLVIFPPAAAGQARLAYRVLASQGLAASWELIVDAATGEVLEQVSQIKSLSPPPAFIGDFAGKPK